MSTSPGLSNPALAREHARAQAAARAEVMPTVPPRTATDLPDGVDASTVVWDEVVGAGCSAAKVLARGTRVRLTDLHGDASAAVLVHHARQHAERLNVADTVKVQWQAYLGEGAVLLSDMGRALMTVVADTSGRHDALCGATNRACNEAKYGSGSLEGAAPNARDMFAVALTKQGLERRDIHPNVTFFKGVRVDEGGGLTFDGEPDRPGAHVDLVAELDVLLTIADTAHVLDPRASWTVTPLRVTAWTDEPTAPGSARWTSSPERERAYGNSEAWLA